MTVEISVICDARVGPACYSYNDENASVRISNDTHDFHKARSDVSKVAKDAGWRFIRRAGWFCPSCLEEKTTVVIDSKSRIVAE